MWLLALGLLAQSSPWNQWLGPDRNGHTSERSGTWPPKKLWEKKPGDSDSSPIICGGRIYLTTLDGKKTAVQCLDARTGRLVWRANSPGGKYARYSHGDKKSYCGPLSTPACDGKLLFTVSVDGDLCCWDARTGKRKWGFNLYQKYRMRKRDHIRDYGYTTSPMLHGKKVLVEVGGNRGAVMAFDKATGREAGGWGKGQVGHSSGPAGPGGRVFFGLKHLSIDGKEIAWNTDFACNIGTPAVSGKYVVCSSAYNIKRTRCFEAGREKWSFRSSETVRSAVIHEKAGLVFLPDSGDCVGLADGKRRWKFGRSTNVIVTGDGRLIAFGKDIRLFDLTGKRLASVAGLKPGWPGGAFGEGFLVFKNRTTVVCYGVRL